MALRNTAYYTAPALDAANEYTPFRFSKDYAKIVFTFIGDNTSVATLKFHASNSETRPSLASAASASNEYDTVEVIDLEDGALVD